MRVKIEAGLPDVGGMVVLLGGASLFSQPHQLNLIADIVELDLKLVFLLLHVPEHLLIHDLIHLVLVRNHHLLLNIELSHFDLLDDTILHIL